MGRVSHARERLIEVAVQLMRQRSYGAVGVEAICHDAGLSKGSFYHFFPTKSELAIASLEQFWQDYEHNVLEPVFRADAPPLERLARFFESTFARHREVQQRTGHVCGCLLGSLGCELSGQEEPIRKKIEEILARYRDYFQRVLQDAQDEGSIDVADVRSTVKALVAYMEGMWLQAKVSNDVEVLRELTPHIYRLIGAKQSMRHPADDSWSPTVDVSDVRAPVLDFVD
jgi:TetR/AcrR family transcriptional repressor of nem operon